MPHDLCLIGGGRNIHRDGRSLGQRIAIPLAAECDARSVRTDDAGVDARAAVEELSLTELGVLRNTRDRLRDRVELILIGLKLIRIDNCAVGRLYRERAGFAEKTVDF